MNENGLDEILDTLKLANSEGINDDILLPILQETFSEIMKGDIAEDAISGFISIFTEPSQTYIVNSEQEQKKIFNKTLYQYKEYISMDDRLLRNHLYLLTNYDKVLNIDEEAYFYLLKKILDSIVLHKEAIDTYVAAKKSDSMVQRGVAASSSTTIKSIVNKRKNSLEEISELVPHDETVKISLNAINEFIEKPRTTNVAINQTIALFSPEDITGLTTDQYETIKAMGNYLNSDGQIKNIEVFYESLAASIASQYRKENHTFKIMKLDTIPYDTLSEIITVIIRSLYDETYTLESIKVSQPIQLRCMYSNGLALLEFQTPRNIKVHPLLEQNDEAEQLLSEFAKVLRGKLPPKFSS